MLCPLGKRVAGTQLSEQKKTRPVSSTSKHEVDCEITDKPHVILLRVGPQNKARLKPVRNAKKVADPDLQWG